MYLKGPSNGLKNKIINIEENLNETVEHFQRLTRNILCDLLLGVSAIEGSVPGSNVNWNLKMTSTIEMCPL